MELRDGQGWNFFLRSKAAKCAVLRLCRRWLYEVGPLLDAWFSLQGDPSLQSYPAQGHSPAYG